VIENVSQSITYEKRIVVIVAI